MNLLTDADPVNGFPLLEQLPWHVDPDYAYAQARVLLAGLQDPVLSLAEWISALDGPRLEYLFDRSTERSTHVKWCLGGKRASYLVWLHQYKSPDAYAKATNFAASIHDHRYGFVSMVLSGSLDVEWFLQQTKDSAAVSSVTRRVLKPGDLVTITPDEIHRIHGVTRQTCTLVIQGPPVRRHSRVFHPDGNHTETMGDLEAKLPELLRILASKGR